MRKIRVVYADGTSETVELQEAAFGLDGTVAHGPVVSAVLAEREDRSPDHAFPNHTRLSRSVCSRPSA